MSRNERREMAYWLTLAFRLPHESRRAINGLVLTADRKVHLGLIDLVRMAPQERPPEIVRFAATLDHLLDSESKVSAQAFIVDRLLSTNCRLVPITAPSYPPHLARRIGPGSAPTLLTVTGNSELWAAAGIAISGSRKSGQAGLAFAREAGRAVAAAGELVVCGLAPGVDREALEGALEAGGRVLGISAEGLLQSRWLGRREVGEGRLAIVSEFAPDDRWTAGRAMARNRTIAGFSSALVIADCVSSGGTTDQLEVHRSAGLQVYVRRGSGEGALVDEICRRPGVTPLYWNSGPVVWPPTTDVSIDKPTNQDMRCDVTLSSERLQVQVDASRQLPLDFVLDTIRAEYERATHQEHTYPSSADESRSSKVSEPTPTDIGMGDSVRNALARVGAAGATVRELMTITGLTDYRLRKRLRELLDARLASKSGHRYYDSTMASGPVSRRKASYHKASPALNEPKLFSDFDLRAR